MFWLLKGEDERVQYEYERQLSQLQKITYKKKTPTLLNFVYADVTLQYEVEQAKELTTIVHERVSNL